MNEEKPLSLPAYLESLSLAQLDEISRLAKERAKTLREEGKVKMWRIGDRGWNAFITDNVHLAVSFIQDELTLFASSEISHLEIEEIYVYPSEVSDIQDNFKREIQRLGSIAEKKKDTTDNLPSPFTFEQKPVAWQIKAKKHFCRGFTSDKAVADYWLAKEEKVTPLYTTPQVTKPVAWRVWLEELGLWSFSDRYHGCGQPLYAPTPIPLPQQEPMFWVRLVSEGEGYEIPLHHSQMTAEKINSGRYTPLYRGRA